MARDLAEAVADGLAEFIDNPKHRRWKLVRLTPKGDARYRELNARFLAIASTMGVGLSEADIRKTAEILRCLSEEAKGIRSRNDRAHCAVGKVTAAADRRVSVSSTRHSPIEALAAFSLVTTQLPIHRFTGCGTPMIFRNRGSG